MTSKLTNVKFVELDYLGKTKQRIYRVGVELEGGWDKVAPGVSVIRDGSVSIKLPIDPEVQKKFAELERKINAGTYTPADHKEFQILYRKIQKASPPIIGELPSSPLEPPKNNSDVSSPMEKWVRAHFPHYVNDTCGMHVHMGFRSVLTYARLMVPEFSSTIIEYFKRWGKAEGLPKKHPLWPRLEGGSEYCQHLFHADLQVKQTAKDYDKKRAGHRYTVLNYPFQRTSTIECRLLPMFGGEDLKGDVEQSLRAIKHLLHITNAFLVQTAKKEEKFKAALEEEDQHFILEKTLTV